MNIGDTVYIPHVEQTEAYKVCPYCIGNRYLTVIFGDLTQVTIKCDACGPGYEDSTGRIKFWEFSGTLGTAVVTGMAKVSGVMKYFLDGSSFAVDSERVWVNEMEARVRLQSLLIEHDDDEKKKYTRKVDANKPWSFQATYHRKRLKDAKRDIIHHGEALDYAVKMKEKHSR